eukprot:scaffold8659_cov129-Isochrysis_galbana.AAC.1
MGMGDQNRTTPTNAFTDFSPLLANATQRLRQAEGEGSPPAIFLPGAQAVDQGRWGDHFRIPGSHWDGLEPLGRPAARGSAALESVEDPPSSCCVATCTMYYVLCTMYGYCVAT